jgi:hypothetical protein
MLSPELHVMLTPSRAYAEYARDERGGAWSAAGRLLFVALVQGVAISMVATHTVALPTVISVTLCWTITLAIQIFAALILIASAPRRTVSVSCALDLLFLGHAPWTLWLLAWTVLLSWGSDAAGLPWITVTMIVPSAVTARMVVAFAERVLGMTHGEALRSALIHQGIIWIALVAFFWQAVQLWPRILGVWRS